jgi:acid phosphatase
MHRLARAAAILCGAIFGVSLFSVSASADTKLPRPDHVVVIVMENHSFSQIMNGRDAPFLKHLAEGGATFTNAFAETHPSEPNYFALFSGSTHDARSDGRYMFDGPTLAGALIGAEKTFAGYIERGSPRKHNPWESFSDSQSVERDLATFPADYATLPTVSFVIPDLDDDMHDGSIKEGDAWLQQHLGAYAEWCKTHNSLLVVTFDEDDRNNQNRILTIFYGDHVKPGLYDRHINHYTVLRTLLTMFDLPPLAHAADEQPIQEIWSTPALPLVTPAAIEAVRTPTR